MLDCSKHGWKAASRDSPPKTAVYAVPALEAGFKMCLETPSSDLQKKGDLPRHNFPSESLELYRCLSTRHTNHLLKTSHMRFGARQVSCHNIQVAQSGYGPQSWSLQLRAAMCLGAH